MHNKVKLLLIILMAGMRLTGQDVRALLPSIGDLPGWKLSQEPQVYDGDRLFELINGGADIYMEYGFRQVVSAQYTDPSQNNILVEIYEMEDDSAAYGIFSITQQTTAWSMEYGDLCAVTADYIAFWKGRYYINLSWSSRQHIDAPLLARLAVLIDNAIQERGDYLLLVRSFQINPPEKIIYLEGNLGLSNFYYFDYKDIFKINQGIAGSFEGYHRIILKYPALDFAKEANAGAKQSISANKRFTDVITAFQGFSCRDNKGNSILVRQVEEYLIILVGIKAGISLAPLMDEVSLQIEHISQ